MSLSLHILESFTYTSHYWKCHFHFTLLKVSLSLRTIESITCTSHLKESLSLDTIESVTLTSYYWKHHMHFTLKRVTFTWHYWKCHFHFVLLKVSHALHTWKCHFHFTLLFMLSWRTYKVYFISHWTWKVTFSQRLNLSQKASTFAHSHVIWPGTYAYAYFHKHAI